MPNFVSFTNVRNGLLPLAYCVCCLVGCLILGRIVQEKYIKRRIGVAIAQAKGEPTPWEREPFEAMEGQDAPEKRSIFEHKYVEQMNRVKQWDSAKAFGTAAKRVPGGLAEIEDLLD